MIYLITYGLYEDYGPTTIIEGEGDIKEFYREFVKKYGPAQSKKAIIRDGAQRNKLIKMLEKEGITVPDDWENKAAVLFIEWLIKTKGWKQVDYEECHLGEYGNLNLSI
jgi:hypothetical protein